ncbi:hypothetical protein AAGR22_13990 [Erwinia sp. HDF1-3R]|uniref:hypothetical protein n=1 Tax=Erwinia sp. HDF1-3R TaxID=3141543 RepID=UPI0031F4F0FF
MSLRMAKNWHCDILPNRVRLRDGEMIVKELVQPEGHDPEEVLNNLLGACSGSLAWKDSITFRLDNSLVNTLTVPWQEGITTPGELRSYTLSLAQSTFPHVSAQSPMVEFETFDFKQTALAAVLETSLWQTFRNVARQHRLRFRGVATPFQHLLRIFGGALPVNGIFVVAGELSSTFACRAMGEWQHVHRLSFPDFSVVQQLGLVKRLSGLNDMPCYCLDNTSWQIIQLTDESTALS